MDVLWVSFYDYVRFSIAETKLGGEEDLAVSSGFLNCQQNGSSCDGRLIAKKTIKRPPQHLTRFADDLTLPNHGREQERTKRANIYDGCMRTAL